MNIACRIIKRIANGLYRIASGTGTALSQAHNYIVLQGSQYQTTSAHCHVNPDLHRLRATIDFVARPFEADHCAKAYARDLADARRKLAVNLGVSVDRLLITVAISPDAPASHQLP